MCDTSVRAKTQNNLLINYRTKCKMIPRSSVRRVKTTNKFRILIDSSGAAHVSDENFNVKFVDEIFVFVREKIEKSILINNSREVLIEVNVAVARV